MAIAQRVWALISDNTVQNIIVSDTYPMADMLAKNTLGEEAFAVEITQIPTGIGHTYDNGVFIDKLGNVIDPLPTSEEEVITLKAENEDLKTQLATTQEAIDALIMGGI
ncbi:hypothetical protein ACWV26_06685 [Rummeliibacillus sp. JY-2-4R]